MLPSAGEKGTPSNAGCDFGVFTADLGTSLLEMGECRQWAEQEEKKKVTFDPGFLVLLLTCSGQY